MSETKYARIFHDTDNDFVWCVMSDEDRIIRRDGITERNIGQLVKVFTSTGYQTSLYKVSKPQVFRP